MADPEGRQEPLLMTQAEIRAEAERIVAGHTAAQERQRIIDAGVKEYGAEKWNEDTQLLHTLGALARPEFMEVLADMPDAHRVVAELAGDPDQAVRILRGRSPAQVATALGRLAGKVEKARTQAAKPAAASSQPPAAAGFNPRTFIAERNAADRKRAGLPPVPRAPKGDAGATERSRIQVTSSQWTLPRVGRR
jgi:hypothetical protein